MPASQDGHRNIMQYRVKTRQSYIKQHECDTKKQLYTLVAFSAFNARHIITAAQLNSVTCTRELSKLFILSSMDTKTSCLG